MKYAIIAVLFILFIGAHVYIQSGSLVAFKESTFANSQVDTIHYEPASGLTNLSFGVHFKDSVSVTSGTIRRIINGEPTTALAGDTLPLTGFANTTAGFRGSSANPSSVRLINISVTPVPDEFWFIVTYASSGNGVTNGKVRYEVLNTRGN